MRYDEYEPHKYGCISVSDEPLDSVAHKLQKIDFYMHTTDIKAKGLAWCGVTLIPPESLDAFADAVGEKSELARLLAGISEPDGGELIYKERAMLVSDKQTAQIKKKIGYSCTLKEWRAPSEGL